MEELAQKGYEGVRVLYWPNKYLKVTLQNKEAYWISISLFMENISGIFYHD